MEHAIAKARTLIEALPYIRKFAGKTFVIKYGGSAMTEQKYRDLFLEDISLLKLIGVKVVIVHGGGDDISALAKRLGKEAVFVKGHRVTDSEMLEIVEMVLIGKVNKNVVKSLNLHGLKAIGLSGKDDNLIVAKKKKHGKLDIGFVGEVVSINTKLLDTLEQNGYLPVIAPLGVDDKGNGYNINADLVAADIAMALKSAKLIYVTDTDGVKVSGKYVPTLTASEVKKFIKKGDITGGMLPKCISATAAINEGVGKVHIINGTMEHSLILEIFTEEGTGTEIVR